MRRTLLEPEHVQFGKSVRVFVDREIRPHFDRWEADGIVDRSLYLKAGEAGLMGLKVPVEFGGGGTEDMRFEAVMLEELAGSGVMNGGRDFEPSDRRRLPSCSWVLTSRRNDGCPAWPQGRSLAGWR